MNKKYFFIILVISLILITFTVSFSNSEAPIVFKDIEFEADVRIAINKPTGDIYQTDVENITTLFLSEHKGISDLTGIEYFKNLSNFRFKNNDISDLSLLNAISTLRVINGYNNKIVNLDGLQSSQNLSTIDLRNNEINDISVLNNRTYFNKLWLSNNKIVDLEPLKNLQNVNQLALSSNNISDISHLSNITNIEQLFLSNNNITDITHLEGIPSFKRLGLDGNNISDYRLLARKLYDIEYKDFNIQNLPEAVNDLNGDRYKNNITITWTHSYGSSYYDVYRSDGEDNQYSLIAENLKVTTFNDTVSEKVESYFYKIIGKNEGGVSNNSNIVNITGKGITLDEELIKVIREAINKPEGVLTLEDYESVESLNLSNGNISSLQNIKILSNLKELNLSGTTIGSISDLKELYNLEKLNISDTNISSTINLKELTILKELNVSNLSLLNVEKLTLLTNLEKLIINSCNLNDISFLSNLNKLKYIDLNTNNISNLNSLSKLKNLEHLNIGNNPINSIAIIDNYPNLKYINVNNTDITDISKIKSKTSLNSIYVSSLNINDISWLDNFYNIQELDLSNNNITDVAILNNFNDIIYLNLSNNNISNIDVLRNLSNIQHLNISENNIDDYSLLLNTDNLKSLKISGNPGKDYSIFSKYYFNLTEKDFNIYDYELSDEYLKHNLVVFTGFNETYEVWGGNTPIKGFSDGYSINNNPDYTLVQRYEYGGIAYIDDEYDYYVVVSPYGHNPEIDAIRIKDSYLDGDDTIYVGNSIAHEEAMGKFDNTSMILGGSFAVGGNSGGSYSGFIAFQNKKYGEINTEIKWEKAKSGKYLVYASSEKTSDTGRDKYGYYPETYAEEYGFSLVGEYTGTQEIELPTDTKRVLIHSPDGEPLLLDSIEMYDKDNNLIGYPENFDDYGQYDKTNSLFKQSGNVYMTEHALGPPDGIPAAIGGDKYGINGHGYGVINTYILESDLVITPKVSKLKIIVINEASRDTIFGKYNGTDFGMYRMDKYYNADKSISKIEYYLYNELDYVIYYEYNELGAVKRKIAKKNGLTSYVYVFDNDNTKYIRIDYVINSTDDTVEAYIQTDLTVDYAKLTFYENGTQYINYTLSNGVVETLPIEVTTINNSNNSIIVNESNIYPGYTVYKGTKVKFDVEADGENLDFDLSLAEYNDINGYNGTYLPWLKVIHDYDGNGFVVPTKTGKFKFVCHVKDDYGEKDVEFIVNVIEPDFNDDGLVNKNDLEYYKRFYKKEVDGITVDYKLDFNGDGKIDIFDITILSKQIQ